MQTKTTQFATVTILLAAILLSPVTSAAQTAMSDWSRLASIPTGSKLSVKLRNGKTLDGTFSSASDSALRLMVHKTSTDVNRDDVISVHQVTRKSAKAATLIGMGVGAGAGAIVGVAGADSEFDKLDNAATAATTLLGAGVGALGGFLIGRNGRKRVLIYETK